jgi:hypothetical protein
VLFNFFPFSSPLLQNSLSMFFALRPSEFEIVCVQRAVKIQQNAIEHFVARLDATFGDLIALVIVSYALFDCFRPIAGER